MGPSEPSIPRAAPTASDAPARPDICVITTVHGPFDVRIFHKECAALRDAGYRVCLIAPTKEAMVAGGITILPLPVVRRRLVRMVVQPLRAFRVARRLQARAFHIHDPELLPLGVLLRLTTGRPVVYDAHEDTPIDILSKQYLPRLLRSPVATAADAIERLLVRWLSGVIAATEMIAARLRTTGVPTVAVHNYAPLERVPHAELADRRAPCVVYLGGVTRICGIWELLEGVRLARARCPALRALLIGAVTPDFAHELTTEFGAMVELTGALPYPDALRLAATRGTIGAMTYLKTPGYTTGLSTKLLEYMAMGLPVVTAHFPNSADIVNEAQCGRTADPADPQAVARALEDLLALPPDQLQAMGARGRALAQKRYAWESEAPKLVGLYAGILGIGAPEGPPVTPKWTLSAP